MPSFGPDSDAVIEHIFEAIMSDGPHPGVVEFEPGTPPPGRAPPRGTIYDLAKGRAYFPPDFARLWDDEPGPSD